MHLFRDDLLTIKIVVCIYLICSCQRTGGVTYIDEKTEKICLRTWDRGGLVGGGMVGLTGLEPVTPALSRQCSNQLSYGPACVLSPSPTCVVVVEASGFEPLTPCLQSRCSTN
jgi:hypothetical protein